MIEIKKGRGGRREGAGRPRGNSKLYSFRCPGDLVKEMDRLENRTDFITRSIRSTLRQDASFPNLGEMTKATSVKPLHLPYFDIRVAAGFPVPLDNDEKARDIELLSMLCPHPEASYLIRVTGDSMIDAGIFSGDIVIVDKSNRNPSPKEIAVCELNGEYTLKRFIEEDGQAWLVPANPDYPRFPITENDDFSIWGTVTYIIHKARD